MGRSEPMPILQMEDLSRRLRREIIKMIFAAGSGHPAGSLSSLDLMIALYFGGSFQFDPSRIDDPKRDIFILSAGHCCPALYAVLSAAGFFPPEKLKTMRQLSSLLQGHPERLRLPGIEYSSGSLGQGLSVGLGMALATKIRHVFVLQSDAEHQEGQVWEAAMAAAKYQAGNLTTLIDRNQIQIDGFTEEMMPLDPLAEKYRAFGWETHEIDGHDFNVLVPLLRQAKAKRNKPWAIICRTIAGKGISFMENDPFWHGRGLTRDEYKKALKELGNQ